MAGIDYSKLHESEVVHLLLGRRVAVEQLRAFFSEAGFTEEDDFFFLPRRDTRQPWQSATVISADFFDGPQQVDMEGTCDRIKFGYLFASLPAEHITIFLSALRGFRDGLGGEIEHRGQRIELDALRLAFDSYLQDLLDEVYEQPGSKTLAILIQESYPRR